MSVFNYIVEKLRNGIITFVNMVTLANRDYPYHDHLTVDDGTEPIGYTVGKNNLKNDGSQHKFFTSKSTLIMCTTNATIRLNNSNNVTIPIYANNWYEFKSNIHSLIVLTIVQGGVFEATFEGVLPQECRDSE